MKKRLFLIICFLLISSNIFALGAKDWVYIKDYEVKTPLWVKGTYQKGSNITEPRPVRSKYFQVEMGGMLIIDRGVGFFLNLTIIKNPKRNLFIEIEYPNPENPNKPLINSVDYNQDGNLFRLSSPDVIKGIAGYADYKINLRAYDANSEELVDSFTQTIRSYVDTREEDIRIFKKVLDTVLKSQN